MRTDPPTGDELARMLVSMKRDVLDRAATAKRTEPQRRTLSDRVLGVIVAVAILLGLGAAGTALAINLALPPTSTPDGAISTPTPTPSRTPVQEYEVSTATPAPPQIDPLLTVTTIVVRPERLDLADSTGTVVRELSYDDDTTNFVQTLSAVLGEAPAIEEHSSENEVVHRMYTWPGLRVSDQLRTGLGYQTMNVSVGFEAATLGDGVAVTTVSGFAPGQDLASYAASVGAAYYPEGAENIIALETGPERGPSSRPERGPNAHAVAASDWGQTFTSPSVVFAPFNFGHEQGTPDQLY